MRYSNIEQGIFLERPNRFIAYIELQGRREKVHVKNTGRCAELLRPGARVYVHRSANPNRSTKWDLVAVEKGEKLINMDSQVPNMVVKEWLEQGHLFGQMARIRPETTYKNSRFDFYIEAGDRKIFIEVKGVTLEENGVCKFPDAPSERAVKHLRELCAAVEEGFEAYVLFVIQMKDVRYFTPNSDTHLLFAETLKQAEERGVHLSLIHIFTDMVHGYDIPETIFFDTTARTKDNIADAWGNMDVKGVADWGVMEQDIYTMQTPVE